VDIFLNSKTFILALSLLFTALAQASTCNKVAAEKKQLMCLQVSVHSHTDKALSGMVVYLEPLDGQVMPKSSNTLTIAQHAQSFEPYLSISQVNQQVNFENQDDITHHIYSAGSENKFSFKIRTGKTSANLLFEKPDEIAMGCNIHDWMSGYLLLLNTPYFAKTNAQGFADFAVSEQGSYRVVVWHPQMQAANNRMVLTKQLTSNDKVIFTLDKVMQAIPKQENADDFDFLSDY